jgi:hypothetical protein
MEKLKIEDLKQVSEIHEKILGLIHNTGLSETLIEEMLAPVEKILTDNGVSLKEYDV